MSPSSSSRLPALTIAGTHVALARNASSNARLRAGPVAARQRDEGVLVVGQRPGAVVPGRREGLVEAAFRLFEGAGRQRPRAALQRPGRCDRGVSKQAREE